MITNTSIIMLHRQSRRRIRSIGYRYLFRLCHFLDIWYR